MSATSSPSGGTVSIRNFCIIAHIDHGKSTLADRLIEMTHAIDARKMKSQVLDTMELERERGITIKLQAIRLSYQKGERTYTLNLIDTPGHVDFSYEVSRSLVACEGALLVVDASQGVEAQTLVNAQLAKAHGLAIIPVVNKIDLPAADPKRVSEELVCLFQFREEEILYASAKDGLGVDEILEAVVARIPPPQGDARAPLQALIFDSHFDAYRGVICYTRVVNGVLRPEQKIRMMRANKVFEVQDLGVFAPTMTPVQALSAGQVGYVVAGVKDVQEARVGETITDERAPAQTPLPGYQKVKPMVFCGFYPVNTDEFPLLREAMERLQLNDAALSFEPETSQALGFGFRCGFLGLLHLEIIKERVEREYHISLIATSPNVVFNVHLTNGKEMMVENPAAFPNPTQIEWVEEPMLSVSMICPSEYVGRVMELAQDRRGKLLNMEYLDPTRTLLKYELPLAEVITDFHDQLKSLTRGYASLDYEVIGYQKTEAVKLDILINQEPVDALSFIIHKDKAYTHGRKFAEKLREVIPRQMFEVPIQAAIGGKVIARETIPAMRKNVLQKCYGGDVSRKRKLLQKQKEGKKKMKRVGRVDVPQEAFLAVLKLG